MNENKNDNQKIRAFKSCFITDVQINNNLIQFQDSNKNFFFLNVNDSVAFESFKMWFDNVFLKGVAQTPSVFVYEKVNDKDGAYDFYIKKFILKYDEKDLIPFI